MGPGGSDAPIGYTPPGGLDAGGMQVDYGEIGRTGLWQFGGFIREELLPQLQGTQARRVYREMRDNDAVIGALMFAIEMLLREVTWHMEPATEDGADVQLAEFVESALHDMSQSWEDTLGSIVSFLPFGFSYHEIVYKKRLGPLQLDSRFRSEFDDGLIGWRKFAIRAQETLWRWELDDDGGIQGMWQLAPPDFKLTMVPIDKALLFRTSAAKNNPEGRSVLRNAYRSWYFLKRIQELEGIGIERHLAGLPVAYVPAPMLSPNASADEKQALAAIQKIVRNLRVDEKAGIVFPIAYDADGHEMYKLELLSPSGRSSSGGSSGGGAQATDSVITRYEQRIAMTVLADFILLGHESTGTYALGVSKAELFALALGAWADSIADVVNTHAIPRLLKLNGIPAERAPHLTHEDIKQVDLAALGGYVLSLAQSGMPLWPNPEAESFLLDAASIPTSGEQEL